MIALAQSAFDLTQHLGLARYFAHKYTSYDPEEANQDALIALWKASKTYDPTRASFSTHAAFYARNIFNRHSRYAYAMPAGMTGDLKRMGGRWRKRKSADTVNIDALFEQPRAPVSEDNADAMEEIALAMPCLPKREREVIQLLFFDGWNLYQAGDILGLCSERVRQFKEQALGRMRRRLLRSYSEVP